MQIGTWSAPLVLLLRCNGTTWRGWPFPAEMQIWSGSGISLLTLYGACVCTWEERSFTTGTNMTMLAFRPDIKLDRTCHPRGSCFFLYRTSAHGTFNKRIWSIYSHKATIKRMPQNLTLEGSPSVCDSGQKKGCGIGISHSCGCANACVDCRGHSRRTEMICPGSAVPWTSSELVLMEEWWQRDEARERIAPGELLVRLKNVYISHLSAVIFSNLRNHFLAFSCPHDEASYQPPNNHIELRRRSHILWCHTDANLQSELSTLLTALGQTT